MPEPAKINYSNRSRGMRFRQGVDLYLRLRGLPVSRKPDVRRLSEAFRDDAPRSAIWGLDGWHLRLRDDLKRDLPGEMDAAARDALHDGTPRYAVIWSRQVGEIPSSFVVLPLDVFADILTEGQPSLGNPV